MDLIVGFVQAFNARVAQYVDSFEFTPNKYMFLFPPDGNFMDRSKVLDLVEKGKFPVLSQLSPAIAFFFALSLGRLVLQTFIIKPLAFKAMTLKHAEEPFDFAIEKEFPKYKKTIKDEEISKFAQSFNRSEKEVRRYLRIRKNNQIIDRKVIKFVEASWRFLFFTIFTIVGYFCVLYPEPAPWIKDYHELWIGYPYHDLTDAIKWYYIVYLGSYLHQLLWTEIARSDSWQMISHHFITLTLIVLSWVTNFVRIGTAIMIIHDVADVFLELAKVLNYTSKGKGHRWLKLPTDIVFGIFAVVFFVTRLVFYPKHILYSLFFVAAPMYTYAFIGAWIWIFLLNALEVLHLFWFYLIMRMVYKLMTTGTEKDERSDDEEIDEGEGGDVQPIAKKKTN